MEKKNLISKLIIILFILVIIVIAAMVAIIVIQNKQQANVIGNTTYNLTNDNNVINNDENIEYETDNYTVTLDTSIQKISGETTVAILENCINEYYNSIENNNTQKIIDLLDETYKQNNDNVAVLNQGFEKVRAKQIYYKELDFNKTEYYVWADLLWQNYSGKDSVYIIVGLDTANNTYSITPVNANINTETEYMEIIKQTTTENKNAIVKNNNNELKSVTMQTPEIISYYLNDYITMAIYYPEIGYNLLDEEYRNKKFASIEEYKQYIQKNLKRIENATILSYGYEENENYLQYNVIDNNNNTYIIKRTNAMEYSIISDIYTLDLFAEEYDNGTAEEKVYINIQKIVEALNNKDYIYVYNKLTDEFKQTYYPTLQSFENVMNNTLYGNYTVSLDNYIEENNNYICDVKFNGTNVSSGGANIKITMQLKETRDFSITFEIKEAY